MPDGYAFETASFHVKPPRLASQERERGERESPRFIYKCHYRLWGTTRKAGAGRCRSSLGPAPRHESAAQHAAPSNSSLHAAIDTPLQGESPSSRDRGKYPQVEMPRSAAGGSRLVVVAALLLAGHRAWVRARLALLLPVLHLRARARARKPMRATPHEQRPAGLQMGAGREGETRPPAMGSEAGARSHRGNATQRPPRWLHGPSPVVPGHLAPRSIAPAGRTNPGGRARASTPTALFKCQRAKIHVKKILVRRMRTHSIGHMLIAQPLSFAHCGSSSL